ncbi:hypothetical protein Uis1B_1198 [Bifidobacterium margollesii]|uniref:SWIM-type domain-containing protein n=1 Tax=Bifidobacterium margollesii TaxID=2020964 RepID=A0A2N5J9L2_9BIFI|nr:hypothetical protein [Bifidobacterium margollesii]PLS30909.1 hypothetical protein Uis1B_1198 [Bifidobacterium margollesii]
MSLPPKPLLDEFERMFDDVPQILERALDYWQDGRVEGIEEIAPSLFHARVTGSEGSGYDVDIRLNDESAFDAIDTAETEESGLDPHDPRNRHDRRVMSTACTCPYLRTPYCKHVGAALYALRARFEKTTPRNDAFSHESHEQRTAVPHYVLDGILERIEQQVIESDGKNLLFFWSPLCRHYAEYLRSEKEQTLIPPTEAERMVLEPLAEYHARHGHGRHDDNDDHDHVTGSDDAFPRSERLSDDDEYLESSEDPELEQALWGLRTVAYNALHSTDYANACVNLSTCVQALTAFTGSFDGDGRELVDESAMLVNRIRCYLENVAQYADSTTAGKALGEIAQAAHAPQIQFQQPSDAAMLLAGALAFAHHDDKIMWAYDVIDTALERFGPEHDHELPHEMMRISRHELYRYVLMVAYDLRRMTDDESGCQELWRENPDSAPLLLMHAITLMKSRRFADAYQLVADHLDRCSDKLDADLEIVRNGLLDGLLPHGWHTVLECCAEGMNDVDRLADVYRFLIVNCNTKSDAGYVSRFRRLMKLNGTDDEQWHDMARTLARECSRNIAERIRTRSDMPLYEIESGRRSSVWTNPAYEKLIVEERLSDAALTYCVTIDYPSLPLLKTMAISHPEDARQAISNALPDGALDAKAIIAGTGRRGMNAHRTTYRQVAKQLRRYAEVFGDDEMRELAHRIVAQYPNRKALREELAFAL